MAIVIIPAVTTGIDRGIEPLVLPPRLQALEGGDGRRATYVELFFDLVLAVATVAIVGLASVSRAFDPVLFIQRVLHGAV